MKPLDSLSSIIDYYDAILMDLWGVVHDGSHLYPGVLPVLEKTGSMNFIIPLRSK